jgi:hypothetical protein
MLAQKVNTCSSALNVWTCSFSPPKPQKLAALKKLKLKTQKPLKKPLNLKKNLFLQVWTSRRWCPRWAWR